MKRVRLARSRAAALVVFLVLGLFAAWGHMRAWNLNASHAELAANAATPLFALSRIVDQEVKSPSDKARMLEKNLREAALSIALIIAYSDLQVESMAAQPFAAVCSLLARLDWYLPTNETDPTLQGVNQFNQRIKDRLRTLEPAIRAESARRNHRFGGANASPCDLTAAARTSSS
jgi:hypothetical protein